MPTSLRKAPTKKMRVALDKIMQEEEKEKPRADIFRRFFRFAFFPSSFLVPEGKRLQSANGISDPIISVVCLHSRAPTARTDFFSSRQIRRIKNPRMVSLFSSPLHFPPYISLLVNRPTLKGKEREQKRLGLFIHPFSFEQGHS